MKYLALFFTSLIFLAGCDSTSTVENPANTHFVRFYGQDGDQTGRDFVILPDGNIVLFGTTKPTTPTKGIQWYVAKVDPNGAVIWEREFGGLNDEEARDIELTSTNNLVLVGNTYKSPTDRDLMIITLTLDGVKIDSNSFAVRDIFGNPAVGDEDVATVTDLDTAFLISGRSTVRYIDTVTNAHDAMKVLVKTNLQVYGPSWLQLIGTNADDGSYKIVKVPSGGYGTFYLFGSSNQPNQGATTFNFWFAPLGSTGQPFGQQYYLGSISSNEYMSGFDATPAGYVLSGVSTNLGGGASDLYVVSTGLNDQNLGWTFFWDQSLSLNLGTGVSGNTSVIRSSTGTYYVLGEERSFDDNQNWVLTKINNNGTAAWSSPIVYGGQGLDECGAIKEMPDGRLLILGTMRTGRPDAGEYKMTLIKVNKDGKFE